MEKINYEDSKVLIVDDIKEVLEGYEASLALEGIKAIGISNPIEALDYLRSNTVDVILLDYFMPELNGNEFIERLRAFDNETIIILQTGYADKLPPLEMIDELNIQGYFDKNKGIEELILLVKSSIKTSKILKKMNELNYKNEFVGKLLTGITDKMKNQTLVISLNTNILQESAEETDKEIIDKCCNAIKEQLKKQGELLSALNFNTIKTLGVNDLFRIVEILTSITLFNTNTKMVIQEGENHILNCNPNSMIYILSEAILYLADNQIEEIYIGAEKEENMVKIQIQNDITYTEEIIKKLEALSKRDDHITIASQDRLEIIVSW